MQAGITHFGSCGSGTGLDIYASVSAFQTWIMKEVGDGPGLGFVKFTSNGTDTDNDFTCIRENSTDSKWKHLNNF